MLWNRDVGRAGEVKAVPNSITICVYSVLFVYIICLFHRWRPFHRFEELAQKKREGVGPILDINTKRPRMEVLCPYTSNYWHAHSPTPQASFDSIGSYSSFKSYVEGSARGIGIPNTECTPGLLFTTKRSSTVAAISVLNAIEELNDIEYEPFMRTLIDEVLKNFEFEDASTLSVYSRHRLRDLVAAEDDDCDSCDQERVCESPRGLSVHIGLQPKECPINLIENISVDITIQ